MADQLMYDPATGTQYYASDVKQSAAYYAQAYGPEYQAAAAAAREEAAAQMQAGVPPAQAIANAQAIHNPDATIHPDLANQVLAKSTPVPMPAVPIPPPPAPPVTAPPPPPPGGTHLATLYRFFVQHPVDQYGNQFETGATYPSCSRSNPAGCQGKSFADEASMLAFAQKEGATLLHVSSADEAFSIIEGKEAIDPSKIYTGGPLSGWTEYLVPAAIAYIAWKILF